MCVTLPSWLVAAVDEHVGVSGTRSKVIADAVAEVIKATPPEVRDAYNAWLQVGRDPSSTVRQRLDAYQAYRKARARSTNPTGRLTG